MTTAHVRLDTAFTVAPVRRRLFGSFVEHMGRCVYTGIYEPGHPSADADGFRGDVLELVRELGVSLVRYPGGNFVSGHDWQDAIGPREQRPRVVELAWGTTEPNQVGTDEFMTWCTRAEVEPMLAVNLGTRGVAEAVSLLEYCNSPTGTRYADQRAANGHPDPYGVQVWCLGNEMDGRWQIGRKTPTGYAALAEQTARAMKRLDPGVELVACGSSGPRIETFGTWERTVLERAGDVAEHISLHAYYEPVDGDVDSFLACGEDMSRYIDAVAATADAVAAQRQSRSRTTLSFDEWNVWYASRHAGYELEGSSDDGTDHGADQGVGQRRGQGGPGPEWPRRLAEDAFDVTDAVVVGSMLITLLQHADRVAMACQAQLVNVLAPIMTRPGGPAWRQTIFHPFALTARHARGTVLQAVVTGPRIDTPAWGEVSQLQATATWDQESGDLLVLAVNRSRRDPLDLVVDVAGVADELTGLRLVEHLVLADDDPTATNTEQAPERVVPRPVAATSVTGQTVNAALPAASWHLLRLTTGR